MDPRFTELVLPNGKNIYIENENEDKLSETKVTVEGTFAGGVLAEEMGLGKTVEIIALILANPAPQNWCEKRISMKGYEVLDEKWKPCSIVGADSLTRKFVVKYASNGSESRVIEECVRKSSEASTSNDEDLTIEEIQSLLDENAKHPHKVKTTLVVVPVILVTQWKTELERHAPGLRSS